jgi:hypothetical protein
VRCGLDDLEVDDDRVADPLTSISRSRGAEHAVEITERYPGAGVPPAFTSQRGIERNSRSSSNS